MTSAEVYSGHLRKLAVKLCRTRVRPLEESGVLNENVSLQRQRCSQNVMHFARHNQSHHERVFDVYGAAAIDDAVALDSIERRNSPLVEFDGHDIQMCA